MTTTGQLPLTEADATTLDAYWRAANYLAACQIYLTGNPLLTEPLQPPHIRRRLAAGA
jgi:xylulose-5-phosphate/fructose-6-phosphate phosphoketolase